MALLKHSFVIQLVRKFDRSLKSEVIFRHCSSGVSPVNKQNETLLNVSEKKENSELNLVSKAINHQVTLKTKIEDSLDEGTDTSSLFEITRDNFYQDDYLHGFNPKLPQALDRNTEDLSHLGTEPGISYNIASFAEKSKTVQELIKLGVQLWKFDKDLDIVKMIVNLNFEKDVKPYIQFLHDTGIPADQLGAFISKFPKIFNENLDDLHTRIRYLRAHNYTPVMIAEILCKHPLWLSHTTQEIDTKLGYFQHTFKLKAKDVRILTVKMPKLISCEKMLLERKTFVFHKMMGFELEQMRSILLNNPRLWTKCTYF